MDDKAKLTVVTQAVFDIADAGKVALGIKKVWYGEQLRIPETPALAVESNSVHRELAGVVAPGGRTLNTFTITVIGYLSRLDDNQVIRKDVDELMEAVEALYWADTTWGGTVIHGYPTDYDPGYTTRQGDSFRVGKLTLLGITKTNIV